MKRKVLITGAAGFIGSRLAWYLRTQGYEVVGCDIYNSVNHFFDVGDTNYLNIQRLRHDRLKNFFQPLQIEYHP